MAYVDPNSFASDAGGLTLSLKKLEALEPALLGTERHVCSPVCNVKHTTTELQARLSEHLEKGDSRAAVVVSTTPLLVAAWSDDLDGAVLLRFPGAFVERYSLTPGTRLLTVNLYQALRHPRTKEPVVAVDLVPGPMATGWSNVLPCIAEFVSDDTERIEARKRAIDEAEWRQLDEAAKVRVERLGANTARPGSPLLLGTPVAIGGSPDLFRSATGAGFARLSSRPTPEVVMGIIVAIVILRLLLM
ncbi:MAG: hypothetical protein GQE15_07260 [Archangiaceae bacterium]|nr:hypothetical protein [Archangiaceae bacterium]